VEPNVLRSRNKSGKDEAKPAGMFQEKVQSVAKRACWNVPRESQEGSIKSILECSRRGLRAWHQKSVGSSRRVLKQRGIKRALEIPKES